MELIMSENLFTENFWHWHAGTVFVVIKMHHYFSCSTSPSLYSDTKKTYNIVPC